MRSNFEGLSWRNRIATKDDFVKAGRDVGIGG